MPKPTKVEPPAPPPTPTPVLIEAEVGETEMRLIGGIRDQMIGIVGGALTHEAGGRRAWYVHQVLFGDANVCMYVCQLYLGHLCFDYPEI